MNTLICIEPCDGYTISSSDEVKWPVVERFNVPPGTDPAAYIQHNRISKWPGYKVTLYQAGTVWIPATHQRVEPNRVSVSLIALTARFCV